eukprot:SAG31_NODE_5946_length_2246_cov_1.802049_2_plen_76_part_00
MAGGGMFAHTRHVMQAAARLPNGATVVESLGAVGIGTRDDSEHPFASPCTSATPPDAADAEPGRLFLLRMKTPRR